MRTTIKTLVIAIAAMICTAVEASAQKISAAIVEQHYSSETASYKYMMIMLAIAYVVYMMVTTKRKREIRRMMGKA